MSYRNKIQVDTVSANYFLAGINGSTGAPSFRAIVSADINSALTTPGPIGSTTANSGSFTSITASSTGVFTGNLTTNSYLYINTDGLCSIYSNGDQLYFTSQQTAFNFDGQINAPSFWGSGAGLDVNSIPTTSIVHPGGTTSFLRADGSWATPTASVSTTDDATTSSTCYPVWQITGAGTNALKITSSKMTWVPSTGVFTVTGQISSTGKMYVGDTTAASSTTVGAFQVIGGIAIGGGAYFGAAVNMVGAKIQTAAGTTSYPSINIGNGTAPTTPTTGDIWAASGVLTYYNGSVSSAIALQAVRNTWTKSQVVSQVTITYAATPTIDASLSDNFTITLTGGITTFSNPTNLIAGQTLNIQIKQDATGSKTITSWGTMYKFPSGMSKVLSTAANAIDHLSCYYDGTQLICSLMKGLA